VIKRIVKLLIALGFQGVEKISAFFRNNKNKPGTCVVLMYHDVMAENYSRFVQQMETLPHLATVIATDSIDELKKGRHHVAITFDDGFAHTIDLVMPVLTHRAIPVTFFIPTNCLGKKASWITDMELSQRLGPILTIDSLRLLSKHNNVIIGSHGINHKSLLEMTDDVQGVLVESKKILENITGKDVKMYSFPFGEYADRHVAMAHEAGYNHVFTVDPTIVTGVGEAFVIGRVEVDPTDWPLEFKLKVLGAYRWHPFVSRLKKRL